MGYRLDLDEMDEAKLIEELERRKTSRAAGLCDYCGRAILSAPPCKFPDRHKLRPTTTTGRWRSG